MFVMLYNFKQAEAEKLDRVGIISNNLNMKSLEKFKGAIIKEAHLGNISGGSGNVTGTSECTWESLWPDQGTTGDSLRDGDWVATC